ncbi:MAG: hypothetical protein HKN34_09615 [Gammaproteobacteria bacterium]|nr:hypothetical protein [Gammaproteobacteria bacterium]
MTESIDRRYLGVLKCIDRATGFHLSQHMRLESDELSFLRNRSNLYVISKAIGLEQHSNAFEKAPTLPATGSIAFDVEISDPKHDYLPRTLVIDLPRDADPANLDNNNTLFKAIDVQLYAAPKAQIMANWSTVRVSVMRDDGPLGKQPVAAALLRVIRESDDEVLSSGLSDQRGEALVIIPGIPITQFADEDEDDGPGGGPGGGGPPGGGPPGGGNPVPVVISEIPARLEVSVASGSDWPVNPDLLELNHAANLVATESLTLRTGRMEKVAIQLT